MNKLIIMYITASYNDSKAAIVISAGTAVTVVMVYAKNDLLYVPV